MQSEELEIIMQEKLEILNSIIDRTNGKLHTIMALLEKGEMLANHNKLILSDSMEIQTVYENKASVSIGKFKYRGDKMVEHEHSNITEYIICVSGKINIYYNQEVKTLNYKECILMPANTPHSIEVLEDDTELVAVCVPADEGYKRSYYGK
jgi:quercetin dioxygenase-like cupin family protein